MIPEIQKILYTTDLSENARHAFGYAASLANRYDASVTIFHILEDISPTADSLAINIIGKKKWEELRGRNEKEVLETIKSRLGKFCEDVQSALPSCPFITENIFQKLNEITPVRKLKNLVEVEKSNTLIKAQWPEELSSLIDEKAEKDMATCQKPVRAYRDIKNKYNIPPSTILSTCARAPREEAEVLNDNSEWISFLARIKDFTADWNIEKPTNAAVVIRDASEYYARGVIDLQAERARLEKQKQRIEDAIKPVYAKLNNEDFVTRAKRQVVAQAREKFKELSEQLKTVQKHLTQLDRQCIGEEKRGNGS